MAAWVGDTVHSSVAWEVAALGVDPGGMPDPFRGTRKGGLDRRATRYRIITGAISCPPRARPPSADTQVGRDMLVTRAVAWTDLGNLLVVIGALAFVQWRPRAIRLAAWVVLAAFVLNAVDGVVPFGDEPVSATHLLLPLLALYSTLVGDLLMTVLVTLFVLGFLGFTWWHFAPLAPVPAMMLSNLMIVTVSIGVMSWLVWMGHRDLVRAMREQAAELRARLDENLRLNATIFHDINNPLAALQSLIDIGREDGQLATGDLEIMRRMTARITSIIDSVRRLNLARTGVSALASTPVPVERLAGELAEIFDAKLRAKGQALRLAEGAGLCVHTNAGVLCNSVLANFVSNAHKFSPRGATIELFAASEPGFVRVGVRDQGAGFPAEALAAGAGVSRRHLSLPGTELESGSGYGLRIAAVHLEQLGGRLAIANRPDGGAVVSALLPARRA